jgi:hypothetical protein
MPPLFHRGGGSSVTPLVYVTLEPEGSPLTHSDPSVISQNRADDTSPTTQGRQKQSLENIVLEGVYCCGVFGPGAAGLKGTTRFQPELVASRTS